VLLQKLLLGKTSLLISIGFQACLSFDIVAVSYQMRASVKLFLERMREVFYLLLLHLDHGLSIFFSLLKLVFFNS